MSRPTTGGKPPRIVVFSEVFYPEETSTGHLITRIAEGLAEKFQVSAVVCQPTYSLRGIIAPRHEVRHGVTIRRVWSSRFNKDLMAGRLANAFTATFTMMAYAIRHLRRGDAVLVVTNPPVLPFAIAAAVRLRGSRMVLVVHDLYPDLLLAARVVPKTSPVVGLLRWASQWLYRTSATIVVVGRDMKSLVEGRLGGRPTPVIFIPNFADVELVRPTSRKTNPILESIGATDRFVVQCVGNMGRLQGLETILEAAELLRHRGSIHFLFVGWGARRDWLEGRIEALDLRNVTLLPPRPRSESGDLHNACDLALISLIPGMTGVSVPSRVYNSLAAGKPILAVAGESSELAMVVREEAVGWVTPPGDATKLAEAILLAESCRGELPAMGERARASAEARYSPAAVGGQFVSLFEGVLQ